MCGINGFFQFDRQRDKEELSRIVHKMNEQIVHRGPNHEGLFANDSVALGMRRLSIIDLEGGNQPIWNETRDKLIIFNGEIYNYEEIKSDLICKGHIFETQSDTEVVLHGFEAYGINILDKIEGMFALAIYDTNEEQLFLARDRAGEKPLYYYSKNGFFMFGSEMKSLLATELVDKEIDDDALSIYFQLTYIPAPYTIFKDVYKLMPGSWLKINRNKQFESGKYWELSDIEKLEPLEDYETCKKQLRETLFHSVEERMKSDVPIGAFLSGGFDSSIIVGIMSSISSNPINTFTIGFNDKKFDESKLAGLVAERNHTNHKLLKLDWDHVAGNINGLIQNIDEPFADSSLIATYAVSRIAKEYVTVILTGDAGDELFGGYNKYLGSYYGNMYRRIPAPIRNGVVSPIVGCLPKRSTLFRKANKVIQTAEMNNYDRILNLTSLGFKQHEITKLIPGNTPNSLGFIRREYLECHNMDEQTRAQYVDFCTVLEGDMLAKVDRASMFASVETRVPMLSRNVIETAFRIPSKYKIDKKRTKIILKDTFKDLLPDELYRAPKHGFSVPIAYWLETVFKEDLYRYADKEFVDDQGIFDSEYIRSVIDAHMNHRENRFSELWAYYVFQNWYERVLRK